MTDTLVDKPADAAPPGPPASRQYTLSNDLVTLSRGAAGVGESFRALRTHVMAQHVPEGRRALAVCAATQGVGCTYTAANLAVAISQIGVRTLLMDVNLRSPSVHQLFKPETPAPGLVQCLEANDSNYAAYIQDVLPDLSVMFAGGVPVNAQELLAGNGFADLMNFCMREFEMTILDTPPASVCSDLHRVSTVVGYSMVVARRDKTYVSDLRQLIHELHVDRATVVGTVLTEL